jgi:hypothetical protein
MSKRPIPTLKSEAELDAFINAAHNAHSLRMANSGQSTPQTPTDPEEVKVKINKALDVVSKQFNAPVENVIKASLNKIAHHAAANAKPQPPFLQRSGQTVKKTINISKELDDEIRLFCAKNRGATQSTLIQQILEEFFKDHCNTLSS